MKKITLAFGMASLLLCSIFTVCQGYDSQNPFYDPITWPTIPTTGSPDKKLLDKDPEQFFREFGRYVVMKMKGASDLQKARRVILEVGNLAKEYNFYANVNLRGRALDILNQKGNCGYWREHLKEAFKGAGIPNKKIISVESYEYEVPGGVEDYGFLLGNLWKNLDVNHLHTSIAFVDDDGKIYTFDVWQYGADHAFIGGRPSLRQKDHVGVSTYNAMPLSEWIEIQKKAGRNVIGSDETLLENSGLYQNFIRDTLRLIMEKEKKGELEIKSGRSEDITALIEKMASFLIIDKSRVDPEEMIKVIAKKGLIKIRENLDEDEQRRLATAAYQQYIAAYNKLTDLMAKGKGHTPEAKLAYEEYKKAKRRYEQLVRQ